MQTQDSIELLVATVILGIFISLVMFNDTLRGGLDMAGAKARYLYNRASSNLGLSSFNDDELNETEKARNIKNFRSAHVGGLYNEGNTCFMNSVLQALASCDPIADYVGDFKDDLNFTGGLGDVISNLNQIHTRQHGYSTLRLVRQIGGAQRWSRYNQEDAQEFFQELLTTLEKDKESKTKKLEKAEEAGSAGETEGAVSAEEEKAASPSNELKRITPFDGSFAVRVGCLKCGDMEGIRKGVLSSVDLSLGLNTTRVSLDALLKNYIAMEQISEVECYRCSLNEYRLELMKKAEDASINEKELLLNAFQKRVAEVDDVLGQKVIDDKVYSKLKCPAYKVQSDKTKQTMFARPNPDVLMIHINRSVFDLRAGIVRKNFASVDFPVVLNLAPYTVDPEDPDNADPHYSMKGIQNDGKDMYDLKAAVVHYGSANFGHYISFRKFHGFWWRISDDQVDLTTESQVLNAQGVFMLFYEKQGASNRPEFPTADIPLTKPEDSGEDETSESSPNSTESEDEDDAPVDEAPSDDAPSEQFQEADESRAGRALEHEQ